MHQTNLNLNATSTRVADNGDPTALREPDSDRNDSTSVPLITIFAIPKPFDTNTDLIQRNAINSWSRLGSEVEVLLIGDETGIAETAAELEVGHVGGIEFNQHGTPLVSSAFQIAHRETRSPFLVYCNCDVILMPDFLAAIKTLVADESCRELVAFGRRTDLKLEQEIDFDQQQQVEQLLRDCDREGTPVSNACKEYFIFNRGLYADVPKFAIGRGNWDNWMIHFAKEQKIPAISLSDVARVIHQEHDYSHTPTSASARRLHCYVSGEEARENLQLAGGRHLISGSTPSWRLTTDGLVREKPFLISRHFWSDIPRFTRLLLSLLKR